MGYFPVGWQYGISVWNIFDVGSQLMVLAVVGCLKSYGPGKIYHNVEDGDVDGLPSFLTRNSFLTFLSLTSVLLLGKTVSYLRGFPSTAWLVVVLSQNLSDMKFFLLLMTVIVVFFAGSFSMLFSNIYMDGLDDFTEEHDENWEHYDPGMADDTVMSLSSGIWTATMKVFEMGMLGGGSTKGFNQSTDQQWTSSIYILFMIFLQIVALNGLIALLGDSFTRVLATQDAKVNLSLANLMVEYMDCWEGPVFGWKELSQQRVKSRANEKEKKTSGFKKICSCCSTIYDKLKQFWVYANGGALEELEQNALWTHRLKVSNSHEEQVAVLQQLFKLMESHSQSIYDLKDVMKKDSDFIKNEILEVRKDVEKNVLIQLKDLQKI